ncbi:MAG: thiol protease/hemagglutinin PrtT [Tannerella sp.]|jgi:hypothetical protein|nr:thiol protease/hemagglutinin PrtT [Tannerella sp.]
MKKICFFLLTLLVVTAGFAKNRTQKESEAIAASFYSKQFSLRSAPAAQIFTLAYACTDDEGFSLRSATTDAYYYVFNIGDDDGFIIISGDDRANDVLGYATSGHFDIDRIPSNFRNWLSFYRSELKILSEMPDSVSVLPVVYDMHELVDSIPYASEIQPLLGQIAWGQREPFNELCPIIPETEVRAVAGCVAIAMAQIMKYYEWPIRGTGAKSYVSEKHHIRLNADFSQTTYDWANIRDTYTGEESEKEKSAVSTLVYHCGVASEMNYSYESGASQQIAAFGMKDHFNYDPNMQLLERSFYSTRDWYNLLKKELNASRPVFYIGARSNMTAHAFVCDGYDRNGLFHFNWGWTGSSNGYFNTSVVESWNMSGYNGAQNIIVGIQPAHTETSVLQTQLFVPERHGPVTSESTFGRDEKFGFSTGVYHTCVSRFSGEVGIGLYDNEDELIAILYRDTVHNMRNNDKYVIENSISIPYRIRNGEYVLHPVSSTDGVHWKQIRSRIMTPVYMKVIISEQSITLVRPANGIPNLILDKLTILPTELFANTNYGLVEATLSNIGQEEARTSVEFVFIPYNVPIEDYIVNGMNVKYPKQVEARFITLNPDEKKTVSYKPNITIPAGHYSLFVLEHMTNKCLNAKTPVRFTILPEPALVLAEEISFPYEYVQLGDTFTVTIKNRGTDFAGYILVDIFDGETGLLPVDSLKPQAVNIRKNEQKTLEFIFNGQSELPPDDYTLRVSYATTPSRNGLIFAFEPKEYASLHISIKEIAKSSPPVSKTLAFYPNPARDVLYIHADEDVNSLSIYDLNGKQITAVHSDRAGVVSVPVHHLPPGIYILRYETRGEVRTGKFVKL